MSNSNKVGRPKTTGTSEGVLVRLPDPILAALNDWIEQQDQKPSRPEAIRRLLMRALNIGRKS
jgi:hypothetical protein